MQRAWKDELKQMKDTRPVQRVHSEEVEWKGPKG